MCLLITILKRFTRQDIGFLDVYLPRNIWSRYMYTCMYKIYSDDLTFVRLLCHSQYTYEIKTDMSEEGSLCPVSQFLFEANPSSGSGEKAP